MSMTGTPPIPLHNNSLLQLLLGAEVVGVSTLLLAAVGCSGVKTGIALSADHLVAVVLHGQNTEGGLNDTTTQTEHQVKGGFWKNRFNVRQKLQTRS